MMANMRSVFSFFNMRMVKDHEQFFKVLMCLIYLWAIVITSFFNTVAVLALILMAAACVIKMYQLDPEPYILMSLNTMVSACVMCDPTTSLLVVCSVLAVMVALGSSGMTTEQMAVLFLAVFNSQLLSNIKAVVAVIVMTTLIVVVKFRPLRAPKVAMLVLQALAISMLVNRHLGATLAALVALVGTAAFIVHYIKKRRELRLMVAYVPQAPEEAGQAGRTVATRLTGRHHNGCLQLHNITDSLDLHGFQVTSALKALHQFLKEQEDAYKLNRTGHTRFLRVITGEGGMGMDKCDDLNLVKPTVVNFLHINKYKFHVPSDTPGIVRIDLESHVT